MTSLRCAGCAHANELGARFCAQCGASLAPRCSSCGAELPVAARFCSGCGAAVAADPVAVADGTLKVISVVFADLVGSTALQESLDTESVRRVMTRFYEGMRAVVERHEGSLQKFIGDAVVVVFGAPLVREDDALRAVRCAVEMAAALEELNEELEPTFGVRLRIRTGVNTGELVVNDDGILVGDTMNVAARFEQAAGTGEVLIGEATRRLVRHQAQLEDVAPLALKGKSEPVRAWRVLTVAPGPSERLEAQLVGRASELGRLRSVLDDAVTSRRCRLVSVVGSPGLGKSRLAQEFAKAVSGQATVVGGQCEASGEGITFLPVADVLRSVAGIGEADPPGAVVEKLTALLPGDADRDRLVARAAGLLGAAESASPEETFWSVRRVLEAVADRRPLVVVLDDVHWGQPLFLDLIEHLVEWVREAPVLLVVLARPELREMREALTSAGRRASEVIELEPLDSGESRELVEGVLGHADLPAPLLERILETTDGNPLFLSELLRMLVDEGALVRAGDGWVAAGGADAVQVPPTIQALLTARIERLGPHERTVVERASVIGKQFYRGAVAELVAPLVRAGIDGHLETLRRKDMVEPEGTYWIDEPVYRFHHVLIRDAAYHLLLKEARAELHERFADWLAAKAGELVGEHEEVVAYHLEQAFKYRRALGPLDERGRAIGSRAAELLWSVGLRALSREDLAAAANLLQRAHECGADDSVLWDLSEALLSAGDTANSAVVVEMLSGPRQVVLETQLAVLTGTGAELAQVVAATTELAAADDGVGAAKGHQVTAQVQAQLGQVAAVEASLDQALIAARKAGDRRRITAVLAAAPRAALWGPSPVVRASGRCLDVVRILRMTPGNRHVEAVALRCQAVLEAMRGRTDAARDILAAGRTTLEELGLTLELHELAVHAGIVELLAGEPTAASELLRSARDGFDALGVSVSAAQAASLLARALVEQRRDEEAIAETEYSEQHAGGDLKTTITWLGARAEALARAGAFDDALALARRAVALAVPTDALADEADAKMALARVLVAAGRGDEARAVAAEAQRLYKEKDHMVGARRAEQLAGACADATAPTQASVTDVSDPAVAEVLRQFDQAWRAHDYDRLLEIYPPGAAVVDHRQLGWGRLQGKRWTDAVRSVLEMWADVRIEIVEVIACADGVIAARMKWLGHSAETGGEIEIDLGTVTVIREQRMVSVDYYEPDDRGLMLDRFEELTGGAVLLGDRPPERYYAEFVRRYHARDFDGCTQLVTEDFEIRDHRSIGWEPLLGREQFKAMLDSGPAAAPDVRMEILEVLACDEDVIALRVQYRGHVVDGGGEMTYPVGNVTRVRDGHASALDLYDPDDRKSMLARFQELTGADSFLGDRLPERWWARFATLFGEHDREGLAEMWAEDMVLVDHRAVGWEEEHGLDAMLDLADSAWAMSPDIRAEINEVIACDDHVSAILLTYSGSAAEGGGAIEIPVGYVSVFASGRAIRGEQFDPSDRDAMLARYAELGGGRGLLGDRPPERYLSSWIDAYGRHDRDALTVLWAEDCVFVDRRQLAWDELRGREALLAVTASTWIVVPDNRCVVDEVLACDERVIAVSCTFHGTAADGGGPTEIAFGWVQVIDDGESVRIEQFDHDHRDGMLARYQELGGSLDARGTVPERWYDEFTSRWAALDLDGILALYAADASMVDRRSLRLWEEVAGGQGWREWLISVITLNEQLGFAVDERIASDDRVHAGVVTWSGRVDGSDWAIQAALVTVLRDGVVVSHDIYDPYDRGAIIDRYAELSGRVGGLDASLAGGLITRWALTADSGPPERLADVLSPDYVMQDHRRIGWETVRGPKGAVEHLRSARETTPDVRMRIEDVLVEDDTAVAMRVTFHGSGAHHATEWTIPLGFVFGIDGERVRSIDIYEPEDRPAMLARHRELASRTRTTERWLERFTERYRSRDVEGLVALYSVDSWMVDHRAFAMWEPVEGHDGWRVWLGSIMTMFELLDFRVDEFVACDERVFAGRVTWSGTAGGSEATVVAGIVIVVENDVAVHLDVYEADDRPAIIERYAELGGGQSKLGDSPPERWWKQVLCAYARADLDRLVELYAEHWVYSDHRQLGWEEMRGQQDVRGFWRSALDVTSSQYGEIDEVIAHDERVIAVRLTWRGAAKDGGGPFALPVGNVSVIAGARAVITEQLEYDDREGMLKRYTELSNARSILSGDSPIELLALEHLRRFNAHDAYSWAELVADDFAFRDHRTISLGDVDGREGIAEYMRSLLTTVPDIHAEVDEVLACDREVIAVHARYRGSNPGEGIGAGEVVNCEVWLMRGGKFIRGDLYDAEDRQAIIARYVDLGGGVSPLGDRVPEQVVAEFERSQVRHDLDAVLELFSPGATFIDHRRLAWDKASSVDEIRRFLASAFEMFPVYWVEVDEVLACDDRVIAMRTTTRGFDAAGAGRFEISFGAVLLCEHGRIVSWDQYGGSDREPMLARYAELGGHHPVLGDSPVEQRVLEVNRSFNEHDFDRHLLQHSDDFVLVDHRSIGWAEVRGRGAFGELVRSALAVSDDVRFDVEEVVACDGERVIALRGAWRGGGSGRAGAWEIPIGDVTVFRNGLLASHDFYEYDDTGAMRARFAELSEDANHGR